MSKKINISVVGTGLMGLQHIKAISKSKKANLHSIVDISNKSKSLSNKNNNSGINTKSESVTKTENIINSSNTEKC